MLPHPLGGDPHDSEAWCTKKTSQDPALSCNLVLSNDDGVAPSTWGKKMPFLAFLDKLELIVSTA